MKKSVKAFTALPTVSDASSPPPTLGNQFSGHVSGHVTYRNRAITSRTAAALTVRVPKGDHPVYHTNPRRGRGMQLDRKFGHPSYVLGRRGNLRVAIEVVGVPGCLIAQARQPFGGPVEDF